MRLICAGRKTVSGKAAFAGGLAILLACLFVLSACGSSAETSGTDEQTYYVWAINSEGDALVRENYSGTTDNILDGLVAALSEQPDDEEAEPLLGGDVVIEDRSLEEGLLKLDFSAGYSSLSATREVLVRAGVVRTVVQADDVSAVSFTVNGEATVTPGGVTLGTMNADSFVEDAGRQINAIQNTTIRLYYSNEAGNALRTEGRSIYYSASKPFEWAIVERVIAGPKEADNYATVPANTQILSVTASNGICYVNLSQSFVDSALMIDPQITIYSIVNSLVDNCESTDMVQIAIEGDSSILYRDAVDLSTPLSENLDLLDPQQLSEGETSSDS